MTKFCKMCSKHKPLTGFSLARGKPDGLQAYCKLCNKDMQADIRNENAEKWSKISPYTGKPYEATNED